jgi:sodium transport system permease protein
VGERLLDRARQAVEQGQVQVVLYFPPDFAERLEEARESLIQRQGAGESISEAALPNAEIIANSTNEKSRIAQLRVDAVLRDWRAAVTQTNLRDSHVPLDATMPFTVKQQDVAHEQQRTAAVWSKILPFVLFIWALTGAFYPAIDLCAGEKERGTLETLLVSPAERREIVWGKLLTIMSFSVVTALLNLASMGLTAKFILAQFREIASFSGSSALTLPPLTSLTWLVIALIPIAAFFSAMCLACAAFARSTKEGQYYLMPLLLVIMPLMMLPMSPGVELNLGNALIPVTGVVLLLRAMIEGQYWQALPYVVPVVGVTLGCCLLAIRWAEDQFNRESVLFRESERLDLGRWLAHLFRDRSDTPTFAQAMLCIVVVLIVQFFVNLSLSAKVGMGNDFRSLAQMLFISQVVCIALPVGLMTLLFTRKPAKTMLLDRLPKPTHIVVAMLLAVLMFPLAQQFGQWVQDLYPYSEEVRQQIAGLENTLNDAPNWWLPFVLIAILPAFCEELAFRGFVLSGLRHLGHKWWAIAISAIAFGMAHFILQQKISAAAVGLVIGLLAVQTASLVPCIVFHALFNSLTLAAALLAPRIEATVKQYPVLENIVRTDGEGIFQPAVMIACLLGAIGLLWWLHQLPYRRTDEEQLQEALDHQQLAGA